MAKKATSKKRKLSLADIEDYDFNEAALATLKAVKPDEFFKNHSKVGEALLECLIDNDTEAFIEILDGYLDVNRSRVARDANIGRSTVQEVLSNKGNLTLKTIAKIVHHEVAYHDQMKNSKQ